MSGQTRLFLCLQWAEIQPQYFSNKDYFFVFIYLIRQNETRKPTLIRSERFRARKFSGLFLRNPPFFANHKNS